METFRIFGLAALLGAAAPAAAFQEEPPERETALIVYGDDPCPAASDEEEIVVCARRPEDERYRIPAPLRRRDRPAETSWTAQSEALEEAQRDTRPDSCSPVGSFGQSGCSQEWARRWRAERRAIRREQGR